MDQAPEFGLPLVTVDVARGVGRLADHAERRNRVGQLPDHLELHRRVGQVISRSRRPPDRPELHRRIGQVISRSRRPPDRPELHRRIGQVISRSAGRPTARNCTVASDRSSPAAAGRPTARNCTVASDRSSPAAASWPTARNCTVASDRSSAASDSSSVASAGSPAASASPSRTADAGRIRRRHSFRVSANSHGRSLEGSDRLPSRCGGDDECVLQGSGSGRRVVKDPMGVAVQGRRVPVVCHGDARRVSRRDRRDNLADRIRRLGVAVPPSGWWMNGRSA